MSINTFVADEREMGEYTRIVDQMRGNNGFYRMMKKLQKRCLLQKLDIVWNIRDGRSKMAD